MVDFHISQKYWASKPKRYQTIRGVNWDLIKDDYDPFRYSHLQICDRLSPQNNYFFKSSNLFDCIGEKWEKVKERLKVCCGKSLNILTAQNIHYTFPKSYLL